MRSGTCQIEGCARPRWARGWCTTHYTRWVKHGDPLIVLPRGGARVMPPRVKMVRPVCAFPDCNNVSVISGRGWCGKHYSRWYRHGDPSIVLVPRYRRKNAYATLRKRSVVDARGCWVWLGAKLPNGYGVFGIAGFSRYVHRASWELVNGPIPEGLELHHKCRNRACCNADHLVALTRAEHSAAEREAREGVAA